jgi:hypothetical protein
VKRVTARKAKINENGEGNAKIDSAASANGRKHENHEGNADAQKAHESQNTLTEFSRAVDEWLPRMDSDGRQRAVEYVLLKANACATQALRSKEL